MKNLKATDKVILTLELTAAEARSVRDVMHKVIADRHDHSPKDDWKYPAGTKFFDFLEDSIDDQFWSTATPASIKVYNALRSALRQPPKTSDFVNCYGPAYKGCLDELFKEWVNDMRAAISIVPPMECEQHELAEVLDAFQESTGAELTEEGDWRFQGAVYTDETIDAALIKSFKEDPECWMYPFRA